MANIMEPWQEKLVYCFCFIQFRLYSIVAGIHDRPKVVLRRLHLFIDSPDEVTVHQIRRELRELVSAPLQQPYPVDMITTQVSQANRSDCRRIPDQPGSDCSLPSFWEYDA